MFRISVISIFLFSLLVGARLAGAQQDYIDELIRLTQLSDNQQYREAINGYKKLESQPAAPDWLKAGAEYEIAELYGQLNETDNAIAALNNAVQLGFDDCLTPRTSKRLATILKSPKTTPVLAGMMFCGAPRPPRQSFLLGPSTVGCVAVIACTVVISPSLSPNTLSITSFGRRSWARVRMAPGQTTLTLTWNGASSRARARVKPTTPIFAAA